MRLDICHVDLCSSPILAELVSASQGVAWPGSSRLGSSSAQLSLAWHGPVQYHSQLTLVWLGLAKSPLAWLGLGLLLPLTPRLSSALAGSCLCRSVPLFSFVAWAFNPRPEHCPHGPVVNRLNPDALMYIDSQGFH